LLPKTYDDKEELTIENWKDFLNSEPHQIDAQVSENEVNDRSSTFLIIMNSVFVRSVHGQQARQPPKYRFKMLI